MNFSKPTIVFIMLAVACIIIVGIFVLPNFFTDEFYYLTLTVSDTGLQKTSSPSNLFDINVSKRTDIAATFKNNLTESCDVQIQSTTLKQLFFLEPTQSYGLILPKGEEIMIDFCGKTTQFIIHAGE